MGRGVGTSVTLFTRESNVEEEGWVNQGVKERVLPAESRNARKV